MSEGICDYVAKKESPKKWHGDDSSEWGLDREKEFGGLDTKKWRCPHPSLEEQECCIFHTDPKDCPEDIEEREVLIEALGAAGESPFEDGPEHRGQFIGATFGALNLTEETIVDDEHGIRFDHAKFRGDGDDITFSGTEFVVREQLTFYRAEFNNNSKGGVLFNETEFTVEGEGTVLFNKTEFTTTGSGTVSFGGASFILRAKGSVSFHETGFTAKDDGDVSFDGAEFIVEGKKSVSFLDTEFITKGDGDVSFDEVEFITKDEGNISFGHVSPTVKGGPRTIGGAEFTVEGDGSVSFRNSKFSTKSSGNVLFSGVKFTTKGEGFLSLRNAEFISESNGNISFDGAEFTTNQERITFDSAEFTTNQGTISFQAAKFDAIEIDFQDTVFKSSVVEEDPDRDISRDQSLRCVPSETAGSILFKEAEFAGNLNFKNVVLNTRAELSFSTASIRNEFVFEVNVEKPVIPGHFNFSKTEFIEPPIFRAKQTTFDQDSVTVTEKYFPATFVGSTDFSDAQLPEGTNFSDFKFTENTTFASANLSGVNFSRADLSGASLELATLNRANLLGTNLTGAKLYGTLLGDARINHRTRFWPAYNASTDTDYTVSISDLVYSSSSPIPSNAPIVGRIPAFGTRYARWKAWLRKGSIPYCRYDPRYDIINDDTLPGRDNSVTNGEDNNEESARLEKSAEVYGTIETLARDNSLQELASEAFIGRKDVQRRQYWHKDEYGRQWLMWLRSMVPNGIARYGESPWRVLAVGLVVVLSSGLAYWVFDLVEQINTGNPATFVESLYFSSLTFTTLGYGDYRPANIFGQALAVGETATGVIMLAILVFVFGRRATR